MAANPENLQPITLSEAAGNYLKTVKESDRAALHVELNRFVRHFGHETRSTDLRAMDVEDYQEKIEKTGADVARRLEPLKAFLTYLHKQGNTEINLGRLIKARRSTAASRVGSGRTRSRAAVEEEAVQLTSDGYDNLKKELEFLTTTKRAEIAHELAEARVDKDFRENAPYDAAKHHQAEVEARIRQIEHTLAVAQVVDQKPLTANQVGLGSTVILKDLTHDEELTYTLVGTNEANPRAGRISIASPVGRALIDRRVGDEIEVQAPVGVVRYQVAQIVV